VMAEAIRDAQNGVRGGETVSRPLAAHPTFPPMVTQMMSVGEETGALDEMLGKVASFYDQEVEGLVDGLTSLIEPLLIVIMGGLVGGMVICLYLPMFNIINQIKQ
jgi:type IV pilus assembly protein PilC